jgi:hypothetical protein
MRVSVCQPAAMSFHSTIESCYFCDHYCTAVAVAEMVCIPGVYLVDDVYLFTKAKPDLSGLIHFNLF